MRTAVSTSVPDMGQERPHDGGDVGTRFLRMEMWRHRKEARRTTRQRHQDGGSEA